MLFMSLLFTLHLCAKSAQKANSNVSDVVTYDSVSQQTNADSTVLIAYEKISTVGYKYFESLYQNTMENPFLHTKNIQKRNKVS